ncbi:MAG: phosphoribosylanthranilate isomerase [Chitinophagales bacterium]|nr:phosphoribosylanthranilate isomerase [Chitinophagales bacterium]
MSMKIKVCGMREPENIESLLKLPIDMIGFIFYEMSPRLVSASLGEWISSNEEMFEEVKKVGVFVNASTDEILNAVHDFQLDYVQLHGDESPAYCRLLQDVWTVTSMRHAKIIKVFSIGEEKFDFAITNDFAAYSEYFLFDTKGKNYGGTGKKFSWQWLDDYQGDTPFLLSGGIGPEDVEAISELTHPKLVGIDVNSRFELTPANKDIDLLNRFITKLKS